MTNPLPAMNFQERSRLLAMPEKLQTLVGESKLTASQAINLATFKGPEAKLDALIEEAVAADLTVGAIRKKVKELQSAKPSAAAEPDTWAELKGYWKQLTPDKQVELLAQARVLSEAVSAQLEPRSSKSRSVLTQFERPVLAAPKPSASKRRARKPATPTDSSES